jgi:hypothetical protein
MFLIVSKIALQFIQLKLDPASGNTVPASGNGSVTQGLNITNNQHGQVYEDIFHFQFSFFCPFFSI